MRPETPVSPIWRIFVQWSSGELHERLFAFAKSLGVEIRLGQDVTEYWEDEERGEAGVLSNGERLHADIVVGADGVRSKARTLVLVCLRFP